MNSPSLESNTSHLVTHHDTTQGLEAIGDRFGEGHQVGLNAVGFRAKPLAGATKAADDFVCDEQDVALVTNALNSRPVGSGE